MTDIPDNRGDNLREAITDIITEDVVIAVDSGQAYIHDTDIAVDEIMQRVQAREQQLLTGLMDELPKQRPIVEDGSHVQAFDEGLNAALGRVVAVIKQEMAKAYQKGYTDNASDDKVKFKETQ